MAMQTATKKTVLISGGSIAGPATAYWLNRYGFQTTIIERWPELRPGGQSIDVAHYGLEAIRRMGLEDALRSRFTGEKGSTLTDKNNKIYMQLPVGNGPTNEFEILRGDFADMLYQETKEETEWLFGDSITSVEEQNAGGKVKVGFGSGKEETYDYLVIAEGSRSRSRKIVFGENGFEYKPIGCYIAYFSIPLEADTPFSDQWHIIPLPRKRAIYFRPDFKANASRAGVMFISCTSQGYENLSPDEQKAKIAEIYADGGENAERMIRGLAASQDLYFEYLGQVHAPNWCTPSGRVLLTGDSAWCGTPVIGMGTSLSCAGAYILAGEMARHVDDPAVAAKAYQEKFGPVVKEAQHIPFGLPHPMFQQSEWGVRVFCNITSVIEVLAKSIVVQTIFKVIGRIWERLFPSVESQTLPEYGDLVVNPKRNRT